MKINFREPSGAVKIFAIGLGSISFPPPILRRVLIFLLVTCRSRSINVLLESLFFVIHLAADKFVLSACSVEWRRLAVSRWHGTGPRNLPRINTDVGNDKMMDAAAP